MNRKGTKWLASANYISADDRARVVAAIVECEQVTGERAGCRPATYIGEPAAIATVIYGPGERIFRAIYPATK